MLTCYARNLPYDNRRMMATLNRVPDSVFAGHPGARGWLEGLAAFGLVHCEDPYERAGIMTQPFNRGDPAYPWRLEWYKRGASYWCQDCREYHMSADANMWRSELLADWLTARELELAGTR